MNNVMVLTKAGDNDFATTKLKPEGKKVKIFQNCVMSYMD
jgi:hypothetical protein